MIDGPNKSSPSPNGEDPGIWLRIAILCTSLGGMIAYTGVGLERYFTHKEVSWWNHWTQAAGLLAVVFVAGLAIEGYLENK